MPICEVLILNYLDVQGTHIFIFKMIQRKIVKNLSDFVEHFLFLQNNENSVALIIRDEASHKVEEKAGYHII